MTNEEKLIFSAEHLFYEIDMFFKTTEIMLTPRDQLLTNIVLESFVVHLRNLLEFFYQTNKKEDDVVFSDFLETSDISWLPSCSATLAVAGDRANKEMNHLTTKRFIEPHLKAWRFVDLRKEILDLLVIFCSKASKLMLANNVVNRIEQERTR